MKRLLMIATMVFGSSAIAHDSEKSNAYEKTVLKCGKDGCSVVCHEPGARWDTYLESKGDLEITYYFASGTRQFKAKDDDGEYTILDTNPAYQSCRITGVAE